MTKSIRVVINTDGTFEAEGHGFSGPECEKAMAFLDELGKVKNKQRKPEYFQRQSAAQRQGQR